MRKGLIFLISFFFLLLGAENTFALTKWYRTKSAGIVEPTSNVVITSPDVNFTMQCQFTSSDDYVTDTGYIYYGNLEFNSTTYNLPWQLIPNTTGNYLVTNGTNPDSKTDPAAESTTYNYSVHTVKPFNEGIYWIRCMANDTVPTGPFNSTEYKVIADWTPPQWSQQGQSTSIPGVGAKVNLSAFWQDNIALDYAWLATNETGSWENKSVYGDYNFAPRTCKDTWGFACDVAPANEGDNTFDACGAGAGGYERVGKVHINATSVYPGATIEVKCNFGYTVDSGVYDQAAIIYYNGTGWRDLWRARDYDQGFRSVVVTFQPDPVFGTHWVRCGIAYNCNDADSCIDCSPYRDNDDANFVVKRPIDFGGGTPGWSNFTWRNTSVPAGTVIAWRIYARDSGGNENATPIMTFEVQPVYLRWSNLAQPTSIPGVGAKVNLSAFWETNGAGFDKAWLATNETGSWENKSGVYGSPIAFDGALSGWSNFSWVNTSIPPGTVVAWRMYANDSLGNENATDIMTFEVKPTYLLVNLTYPSPQLYTSTNPFMVVQNSTLNVNASITCYSEGIGGVCGAPGGSLRYNETGITPNKLINTTKGATPFYIQVPWFNSSWNYRDPILINNTQNSKSLTDYQILVTLDTQTLILANKMQDYCNDTRFTDSDGVTLLNYWLESGCNTTLTKFWVKVPLIPAKSTKTIYIYYGNPSASSTSNGTETFDFFEDFSNPGHWTCYENEISEGCTRVCTATDDMASCTESNSDYNTPPHAAFASSGDSGFCGDAGLVREITLPSTSTIIEFWAKGAWDTWGDFVGISIDDGTHRKMQAGESGEKSAARNMIRWLACGIRGDSCGTLTDPITGSTYTPETITTTWRFYNVTIPEWANGKTVSLRILVHDYSSEWCNEVDHDQNIFADDLRIRKYATPEPTVEVGKGLNTNYCNDLLEDEICQLSWEVNATGGIASAWAMDVNFSSTYEAIQANDTHDAYVKIMEGIANSKIVKPLDNDGVASGWEFSLNSTYWGEGRAEFCNATIYLPSGLSLPNNDPIHYIGNLSYGQTNSTQWLIRADGIGVYNVTIGTNCSWSQSTGSRNYTIYNFTVSDVLIRREFSYSDGNWKSGPGYLQVRLILYNNESGEIKNIQLSETIPLQAAVQTINDGGALSGNIISWKLLSLKPGDFKTFSYVLYSPPTSNLYAKASYEGMANLSRKAESLEVEDIPYVGFELDVDDSTTTDARLNYLGSFIERKIYLNRSQTYKLIAYNTHGQQNLTNVNLTLTIPENCLTPTNIESSNQETNAVASVSYDSSERKIRWAQVNVSNAWGIPANRSAAFRFSLVCNSTGSDFIANAFNGTINSTQVLFAKVIRPHLVLTRSYPAKVASGSIFTISFDLENQGDADAFLTTLWDWVPNDFTITNSYGAEVNSSKTPQEIKFSVGTLAAKEKVSKLYEVQAPSVSVDTSYTFGPANFSYEDSFSYGYVGEEAEPKVIQVIATAPTIELAFNVTEANASQPIAIKLTARNPTSLNATNVTINLTLAKGWSAPSSYTATNGQLSYLAEERKFQWQLNLSSTSSENLTFEINSSNLAGDNSFPASMSYYYGGSLLEGKRDLMIRVNAPSLVSILDVPTGVGAQVEFRLSLLLDNLKGTADARNIRIAVRPCENKPLSCDLNTSSEKWKIDNNLPDSYTCGSDYCKYGWANVANVTYWNETKLVEINITSIANVSSLTAQFYPVISEEGSFRFIASGNATDEWGNVYSFDAEIVIVVAFRPFLDFSLAPTSTFVNFTREFGFSVLNYGSEDANETIMYIQIPSGWTIGTISVSQGTYATLDNIIQWNLTRLNRSESELLRVNLTSSLERGGYTQIQNSTYRGATYYGSYSALESLPTNALRPEVLVSRNLPTSASKDTYLDIRISLTDNGDLSYSTTATTLNLTEYYPSNFSLSCEDVTNGSFAERTCDNTTSFYINWFNQTLLPGGADGVTYRIYAKEKGNYSFNLTLGYGDPAFNSWLTQYSQQIEIIANRFNLTFLNETAQISDANISIYRLGKLLASGMGSLVEDLGTNVEYDLRVEKGNLTAHIKNLKISKDVTPKAQIVENYEGYKPAWILNLTPVFALNDTDLSFNYATLYLPKNGIVVNKIMHCLDWNFSAANCSSWDIRPLSYYNANVNASHVWFNVSNFYGYAGGSGYNANLTIWDDTEFTIKTINEQIKFYANYTNSTSGESINGTGVYCNITFNIGGGWTPWADMEFNSTSLLYEYNRSFTQAGIFNWNVSCDGSALGYDPLNATDTVTVSPYLEVSLIAPNPTTTTNIVQNSTFWVNASVTCRGGDCGEVNGTVRYNLTSPYPDTPINQSFGDKPFFINETPAQAMKSCGTLLKDQTCQLSWLVNASGDINTHWKIGVLFNSSLTYVEQNHTHNATVEIIACVIDFAIQFTSIEFGSLNPSATGNAATGNANNFYNITINPNSCNLDLYLNATDLINQTLSSSIGVGNFTFNNQTNDYLTSFRLSYVYQLIRSNVLPSTNVTTWYWLDVPAVYAGYYTGNVSYKGVLVGESP